MTELLRHHTELIERSAITPEVAAERGYWSATEPKQLERYFGPTQRKLVPALVIPIYDVRGELALMQLRADKPRVVKGRSRKYELPVGCRLALDVPPRVRPMLGDPSIPIVVTEGARKADSAVSAGLNAIAIPGVSAWRGRNEHGGKVALPDHELIAWNGRITYLAFDSDAMQKREVFEALKRYRTFLERLGADIRIVYLPSGEHGGKVGIDDYLAAGHDRHELLELASDELREPGVSRRSPKPAPDVKLRPTAELVHEVGTVLDRFVVLPSRAAVLTVSLYVLHTHAFQAAHATPYVVLQSAVKRSGKSRVEEVLEQLVRRPWRIAAASESALFRKIETEQPTLLLDEADAIFGRGTEANEALRGILNAGNRPGASVARVVGEGSTMSRRAARDRTVVVEQADHERARARRDHRRGHDQRRAWAARCAGAQTRRGRSLATAGVEAVSGPLLDAKGAAALLNVPPSWVLAEARAGRIPHVRLGRYVRFDADELLEWCQARGRGPRRRVAGP